MMAEKKKKVSREGSPNPAFMKPMKPSEALAKIVGNEPLPRTEITKKIWEYIKKNNLQDAKNKRNINADENLLAVFDGKKQVSMFEMTKLVNKHLS
jgi:chromatin remodeling complex protein RSC6